MGAGSTRSHGNPGRPLGRHYLPPRLAGELVRAFHIDRDDTVVEVGAGTGRLTRELARAAGLVLAIELDPRSAAHLVLASSRWPNVYVRQGDALETVLPTSPFRLVGSIPFGITTALLRRITQVPRARRLDLITQYESARKRTSGGNVMSVVWGITWRLELRRRIPGRSFHPSPTVDTAWLMGERRSRPLIDPADLPSFERFVRDRFRHASLPIRRTLRAPRRDLEPQASRQRPGRSIYRSRNGSRSTNGSRDDDDMMRARREPGKAMTTVSMIAAPTPARINGKVPDHPYRMTSVFPGASRENRLMRTPQDHRSDRADHPRAG